MPSGIVFRTLPIPVLFAQGGGTSGPLSPCVQSLGYRLSSGTERPYPEECLQDLSKHLKCGSDLKMAYLLCKTKPPLLFPDAVSSLRNRAYVS